MAENRYVVIHNIIIHEVQPMASYRHFVIFWLLSTKACYTALTELSSRVAGSICFKHKSGRIEQKGGINYGAVQ